MTNYWIEVFPNGNICSCGSFPIGMYPEPKWGGSVVQVDSLCDPSTSLFLEGAIVPLPSKPSPEYLFDYTTKQWVDPRTLDDHKSAKWKEIKRQRDIAEFATFTYNNMEFDGDLDAQRRLAAYISVSKSSIAAGQPFEAEFTLANNTNVTLTAQDFVGIELAKVQAVAATFNHASALRAQIDAATTVQEVEVITW